MNPSLPKSKSVLANQNFLLLWIGQGLSVLGDQFAMIALPWLVLKLTGDPLALGTVLALEGIPRALFMLVGGAVTDRISARTVMLISDILRMLQFALLAAITFSGGVQLWMLYASGLFFGLVDGFFNPASSSIVPRLVDSDQLQTANSFVQGTAQLSVFLGPAIAGGMIALLSGQAVSANTTPGTPGIALSFAIDALSFFASTVTLFLMRERTVAVPPETGGESVLASIRSGIGYLWQTPALRTMFAIILVINLFFVGPFLVGIPVIADTRLKEGVAAFGLIMSAYGGGNLGGILLAGMLPKPSAGMLRMVTVILIASFGVGLGAVSVINNTWINFAILLLLGLGNGYIGLTYITLIQQRTPENMLGRMMSLLMFSNMGLLPIAEAATGALIKINLPAVFIGAGLAIVLTAFWSATRAELLIDPRQTSRQWSVVSAD